MMKKLAAITAVLLIATMTTSWSEETDPARDVGAMPCVDVVHGEPTSPYRWAGPGTTLHFTMQLDAPSCEDASYTIHVTADSGLTGDLPGGEETSLTVSGTGEELLQFAVPVNDNDPTICVYGVTSGTVESGGPVDANGNGSTVDDQHQRNDGDNRNGDKHDWESGTTTYGDRAPSAGCLEVYTVPPPGGGGQGFH